MNPISYKRHRCPPDVIRYAVWFYFRFTLGVRDVEDLLARRGIEVGREAVRCWIDKVRTVDRGYVASPPIANCRRVSFG